MKFLKDHEFWLACGPVILALIAIVILTICWSANEKRVYNHPLFSIAKTAKREYTTNSIHLQRKAVDYEEE
jgi:hypothetical protein